MTTALHPSTPSAVPGALAMPSDPAKRHRRFHETLAQFPADTFQFDPRMREGWYSDRYFLRTAATVAHAGADPIVRIQVFAKESGVLAGVYEAVRMIQTQLLATDRHGHTDPRAISIDTLMDGDEIVPWEPVMHICGPYRALAHLETPYLGVLARRTLVATNVRRVIEAANGKNLVFTEGDGKPTIFMGARHDDWRVQTADGYAAMVGGAGQVSTSANGAWWGADSVGTMPHAMIACFYGDVVAATLAFTRCMREQEPHVKVVSLVDYRNDVIGDSLAVARAMRNHFGDGVLHAVRVDTSEKLEDKSLAGVPDSAFLPGEKRTGVNSVLVRMLRRALDAEGFAYVGIIVSGGFKPSKMKLFETNNVPVVAYGVGSSLLGHNNGAADGLVNSFDFTADIVEVDGRSESKVGRERRENGRFVHLDHVLLQQLDLQTATR